MVIEKQVCAIIFHVALSSRSSSIEGHKPKALGGNGALFPVLFLSRLAHSSHYPIFISHQQCLGGDSPCLYDRHAHTHPLYLAHPHSRSPHPLQAGRLVMPAAGNNFSLSETRCFLIPKATPGEGRPGDGKSRYELSCFSSIAFSFLPTILLSSDMPVCPTLSLRPPYPLLLPVSFFRRDGMIVTLAG